MIIGATIILSCNYDASIRASLCDAVVNIQQPKAKSNKRMQRSRASEFRMMTLPSSRACKEIAYHN